MGELSIYHWLIVLLVILILFGGRKIPELMRGLGEGIRSFREGVKDHSTDSKASAQEGATAHHKKDDDSHAVVLPGK
jgi:sec-independent protein translocase protein TatA